MKKLFTSAFFAFTFFAASLANAQGNMSLSAEATQLARQMVNEVQLNESEYIKVRSYTIEKLERIAEIKQMYSNDLAMMESKLAEAENNYQHNLQAVLSPRQMENYIAYTSQATASPVAGNVEE